MLSFQSPFIRVSSIFSFWFFPTFVFFVKSFLMHSYTLIFLSIVCTLLPFSDFIAFLYEISCISSHTSICSDLAAFKVLPFLKILFILFFSTFYSSPTLPLLLIILWCTFSSLQCLLFLRFWFYFVLVLILVPCQHSLADALISFPPIPPPNHFFFILLVLLIFSFSSSSSVWSSCSSSYSYFLY